MFSNAVKHNINIIRAPLTHDVNIVNVTEYELRIRICIFTFITTTLRLCTNVHNHNLDYD